MPRCQPLPEDVSINKEVNFASEAPKLDAILVLQDCPVSRPAVKGVSSNLDGISRFRPPSLQSTPLCSSCLSALQHCHRSCHKGPEKLGSSHLTANIPPIWSFVVRHARVAGVEQGIFRALVGIGEPMGMAEFLDDRVLINI